MENGVQFFMALAIAMWPICNASENLNLQNLLRRKRYLVFPDPLDSETKVQVLFGLGLPMEGEISMTLGYVLKCNYDLPYNASDFTQPYVLQERSLSSKNRTDLETKGPASRWGIYRMLETAMEVLGSGKACLLRAVCEAAETPFKEGHGLFGEFIHLLLTPSATSDEHELYTDREYHAAERLGSTSGGNCRLLFPECEYSPLDYFTQMTLSN